MVNSKYAVAAMLTVTIFFITLSVINYFDIQRMLRFTNDLASFSSGAQDLEASLAIMQTEKTSPDYCAIVDAAYRQKVAQTNKLMERMLGYERASLFSEFQALKSQFLIANIQLWHVSEAERKFCSSNHTDVLYIYASKKRCGECEVQGKILDSVRETCKDMRIFVMDIDENMASLEIIKKKYAISSAPSLVINGKTYAGVVTADEIRKSAGCQS